MSVARTLQNLWYSTSTITLLLRPLSWLYLFIIIIRRNLYRLRLFRSSRLPVPVIVVGNLTVGGTGKTPVVIYIVNLLKRSGYSPGIISRGYGGKAKKWPQQVRPDCDPVMVGDEAIVIARRTQCPMSVGPDRAEAGRMLHEYSQCDIIVSDDGLQHYKLRRDVEIVVIDGMRRFGNGFCLPAGPLREPVSRKEQVDFVITNGIASYNEYSMEYRGNVAINLKDESLSKNLDEFGEELVHLVAGVGNPNRFFEQMRNKGLNISEHAFTDHHSFSEGDLDFGDDFQILMTEKDAVKCRRFAKENMWYLPIEIYMDNDFDMQLLNLLEKK